MILITISVNLLGEDLSLEQRFFIVFYKEYCHVYTINPFHIHPRRYRLHLRTPYIY